MRFRFAGSLLLLLLAGCGASSAASEPSSSASRTTTAPSSSGTVVCGPQAAQSLASSRLARVYSSGDEVFGCAAGTGHSYHLGASARTIREGRVDPVVVAGRDAAYGLSLFGVDTVTTQVVVRDLATGRQLHDAVATNKRLAESFQTVDSIVLGADGAVAWIAQVSSVISHNADFEVQRIDSRGQSQLDSGPQIAAGSLRLHGPTVTWRHGASTRSATLR